MQLSALLSVLLTTLVAAEPCTSTAPNKPTPLPELCTRICASSPIQDCGRGWYSKQQGACWACCKKADLPVPLPSPKPERCTRICAAEEITSCPQGWYSKQQGGCWSCCHSA
ncbi:hypothetical protein E8E12_002432 [Didymella heteroderae]|uniref:Uncharacterized protein n=1 Tax=Didymella heteroderae TaxID=1769908 RepID=A0A9P4WI49_9PLEO|nr:hypothetical protein E8E12_002432 [Didymella heteroderae]